MQGIFNAYGALLQAQAAGFLLGSRTVITATGATTYTTPAGCRMLYVQAIGSGGAGATSGASSAAQVAMGSGGHGGQYAEGMVMTVGGKTFTATVGAGSSSAGVASSFASNFAGGMTHVLGLGGNTGTTTSTGTTEIFAGSAVSGIGAQEGEPVGQTAQVGGISHRVSGTVAASGYGAPGPYGGSPSAVISNAVGNAGGQYGGGGSGGLSINAGGTKAGGNGGNGVIIVWELY